MRRAWPSALRLLRSLSLGGSGVAARLDGVAMSERRIRKPTLRGGSTREVADFLSGYRERTAAELESELSLSLAREQRLREALNEIVDEELSDPFAAFRAAEALGRDYTPKEAQW